MKEYIITGPDPMAIAVLVEDSIAVRHMSSQAVEGDSPFFNRLSVSVWLDLLWGEMHVAATSRFTTVPLTENGRAQINGLHRKRNL